MPIQWTAFSEILARHQRFLLTSHVRPDCDALGSELGMAGILEVLGKDVRIVNPQPTPPNLLFLDPERRIGAIHQDVQPAELSDREVLIVMDTSAWVQLGDMADIVRHSKARKLIIDHHVGADDLGAEPFKDVEAEATGRLVFDAARSLNIPLSQRIATPLFAAVATDTGWFRFASTSATTYRCAAELIVAGAEPAAIYNALYEQDSLARLQLRGRALTRIKTDMNGRLAYTYVLLDDFRATGAVPSDTEDVVNTTLTVAGTEVGLFFVEQPSGRFKVSLRSNQGLDCNAVASQFGGGGHKAAAGAMVDGPLDAALTLVLDAARAAMP
jgi:phosphoesterase RecJ-like protein